MAIFTINRQYGSGGLEIGRQLAARLGYAFYDRELIAIAAKESGLTEAIFENADERPTKSLIFSIATGQYNPRSMFFGGTDVLTSDTLFSIQADVIRKIAKKPCVIVGRCADYLLREQAGLCTVFTHASVEKRMAYLLNERPKLGEKEAIQQLKRMDKSRGNYYAYYTNRQWDSVENYDLCMKTDRMTTDQAVDTILEFAERKGIL